MSARAGAACHCAAGLPGVSPRTPPLRAPPPHTRPGKTFQCNLAFKKLGISPIVMSAGELESGNAGEPAKLIRQRYREVSEGR